MNTAEALDALHTVPTDTCRQMIFQSQTKNDRLTLGIWIWSLVNLCFMPCLLTGVAIAGATGFMFPVLQRWLGDSKL